MSRAERKIISAICMADGAYLMLRDHYKKLPGRRNIKRLLERLHEACDDAFGVWCCEISPREIERLHAQLVKVERACLPGKGVEDVTVITTLVMGMLDDILDHVRASERRIHLEYVLDRVAAVHRYFDSRGTRWDDYARATQAVNVWHQEMEAA